MSDDHRSPPLEDLKGKLKEGWGELSDDESLVEEGEIQQLAARLEKQQGLEPEEAMRRAREQILNR